MTSTRFLKSFVVLGFLGLASASPAQQQQQQQSPGSQLTLFSEIGFRGKSMTVSGERANLRVSFRVRSARITPGARWEICTQARFRGTCNVVSENQGNIAWTVNSARPVSSPVAPGRNESLRGMSAEFFVQPADSRGRVESCNAGTAACTEQAANRFCQSRGWTASSYHRQETVSGRNYLADVLCTRTR